MHAKSYSTHRTSSNLSIRKCLAFVILVFIGCILFERGEAASVHWSILCMVETTWCGRRTLRNSTISVLSSLLTSEQDISEALLTKNNSVSIQTARVAYSCFTKLMRVNGGGYYNDGHDRNCLHKYDECRVVRVLCSPLGDNTM